MAHGILTIPCAKLYNKACGVIGDLVICNLFCGNRLSNRQILNCFLLTELEVNPDVTARVALI